MPSEPQRLGSGTTSFEYEGEEDDVHGGDFPESDEEPEDADVGAWEEHEVEAGDGGDGAGSAEGGSGGGEDLTAAGEDSAGEVEGEVAEVAEFFVEVVSEDVEEEHVAGEVHEVGVEELVGDELVEEGMLGCEEIFFPAGGESGGSAVAEDGGGDAAVAEGVEEDVSGDEEVVHPGEGALGAVGADGNGEHVASERVKAVIIIGN